VVLKFGGTSVRDAVAMQRVVSIVERERGHRPVVVTSACAGVTDILLECAGRSGAGDREGALALSAGLRQRHLEILGALDTQNGIDPSVGEELTRLLDALDRLVEGVILLRELTHRTIDTFGSFGERLSSVLLRGAFQAAGWNAALADARRFVITDARFGSARPLMEEIDRCAAAELVPLLETSEVVITQGFIGSTLDGVTTTIGRGGSDHTGALLGAALGAREIQIWTDVSGILTADPRVVPAARVVPEVTFTEARELAYFGAKVIHPDTIVPAVTRSIPVVIRNSMRPEDAGTRILADGQSITPGIHSVTVKRSMAMLALSPRTPSGDSSGVAAALALMEAHDLHPYSLLTVEARSLVVVEERSLPDIVVTALRGCCHVEVTRGVALVSLIGAAMRETPALLPAPLDSLGTIPVYFVAAGSSDHIIVLGIPDERAADGLKAIHERLFEASLIGHG
jgi:aspartate kinase